MRFAVPRLAVRQLMVLVVLVAVALGVVARMGRREAGFRSEASRHLELWLVFVPDETNATSAHREKYHWEMAVKYERAGRYPWLPVASDPPEPD